MSDPMLRSGDLEVRLADVRTLVEAIKLAMPVSYVYGAANRILEAIDAAESATPTEGESE